ncbi:MAG: S-layer homology domain-containing protein [Candidatus Saccharibacteria bacterium]
MPNRIAAFTVLLLTLCSYSTSALARTIQIPSDIDKHWAASQIRTAINQGLMTDMGNGRFQPNQPLTRAQLAVSLARLFQLDYGNIRFIKAPSVRDYYDDVTPDKWYSGAIIMCAINGVLPGAERKFRPNDPVTRLEAARAIAACFAAKNLNPAPLSDLKKYRDTSRLSATEKADIDFVTEAGIICGSDGDFRPQGQLTRAETAVLLINTNRAKQSCYS